MHQFLKFISFWNNTLHVPDGLSVHRATGICTVLISWWWTERPSETCRVLFQNKIKWEIGASGWIYYRNQWHSFTSQKTWILRSHDVSYKNLCDSCLHIYGTGDWILCVCFRIKCDLCSSVAQAQYHLTMSDATIRNFCSYQCVMSFQGQYSKNAFSGNEPAPVPTGENECCFH